MYIEVFEFITDRKYYRVMCDRRSIGSIGETKNGGYNPLGYDEVFDVLDDAINFLVDMR